MNLAEFQAKHGSAWARISALPSFNQGLIFLSLQHTERIKNLEDHEITANAVTILSEIRGRLRMEAELVGLATFVDPTPVSPLREQYPDAEQEAYAEQQRQLNLNKPKP